MATVQPIMVSAQTAAKMLDLPLATFLRLIAEGVLPRGREIALGIIRYDVESLRTIARGEVVNGMNDVDWNP